MFDITPADLRPIEALALQIDPELDFSIPGSWGLLFFCCGAYAGRRPSRAAAVFEGLPGSHAAMFGLLVQEGGGLAEPELAAVRFATHLKEWSQDRPSRNLAIKRMGGLPQMTVRTREALLDYFTLAIYLNSIAPLEIGLLDELTPLYHCATAIPGGWQLLFFGAGLVLCADKVFPSESFTRGVVAAGGEHLREVRILVESYANGR